MSVIGPRPGLWNQDILTAERDKYNANDAGRLFSGNETGTKWQDRRGRD